MKFPCITIPVVASAAIAAGCAGGNGGIAPAVPGGIASISRVQSIEARAHRHHHKVRATFVISFRHSHPTRMRPGTGPAFISPNANSFGATVAVGAGSAGSPQFVNVNSCPTVSGVTTCNLSIQALPGSDTFTVSAYSGQSGGGNLLASGSIVATITPGVANVTMPVVLNGIVKTIVLSLPVTKLPLGQPQTLVVSAKDASGATILGTYQTPIALSAGHLTFSPSSLTTSTTAQSVAVNWATGYEPATATADTVTATSGSVQQQKSLTPEVGYASYALGTNANYDNGGFNMVLGPDNDLYYTTLGPIVCNVNGFCTSTDGAIGQFNPTTHAFSEIELNAEAVQPFFSSDGALWIGGSSGTSPYDGALFRLPPSTFTSGSLQNVPIPTPTPGSPGFVQFRELAQDNSGNLWTPDSGGHRLIEIPAADPSKSPVPYSIQKPAGGKCCRPGLHGIVNGSDGNLYVLDSTNGYVLQVNPTNGTVSNSWAMPQNSSLPYYSYGNTAFPNEIFNGPSGTMYIGYLGSRFGDVPLDGGIDSLTTSGTFGTVTLPSVNNSAAGWILTANSSSNFIYYIDFGGSGGLGYANVSTGKSAVIPKLTSGSSSNAGFANGVTTASDGTPWFVSYGTPLLMMHPDYLSGWSLWPSQTLQIYGTGWQSAQIVGIMEDPATSNAPFNVQSDNTSVCTITAPTTNQDHNFVITGVSAGTCNVTVTDKNSVSQVISVGVTTTNGVITERHRKAHKRILL